MDNIRRQTPVMLVFAVLLLAILSIAAGPPQTLPTSSGISYKEIDTYIDRLFMGLNIPGAALAIIEGDDIVHLHGYGQGSPAGEMPTPQTPFFIGSLTKSITALAVMQLVEARKIDLDAPIQDYLTWFQVADPQASARITIRNLLNQTSGLSQETGVIPLANFDFGFSCATC